MPTHTPSYFAHLRERLYTIKQNTSQKRDVVFSALGRSLSLGRKAESAKRCLSGIFQAQPSERSSDGVPEPDVESEEGNSAGPHSVLTMRTDSFGLILSTPTPAGPSTARTTYRGYHSLNSGLARKMKLEVLEKRYVDGLHRAATMTQAQRGWNTQNAVPNVAEMGSSGGKASVEAVHVLVEQQAEQAEATEDVQAAVLVASHSGIPVSFEDLPVHSCSASPLKDNQPLLSLSSQSRQPTMSRALGEPLSPFATSHPCYNMDPEQRQDYWDNLSAYTASTKNIDARYFATYPTVGLPRGDAEGNQVDASPDVLLEHDRPDTSEEKVKIDDPVLQRTYLDSYIPETKRTCEQPEQHDDSITAPGSQPPTTSLSIWTSPVRTSIIEDASPEAVNKGQPLYNPTKNSIGRRLLHTFLCRPGTCSPDCSAFPKFSRLPVHVGTTKPTAYKMRALTNRVCGTMTLGRRTGKQASNDVPAIEAEDSEASAQHVSAEQKPGTSRSQSFVSGLRKVPGARMETEMEAGMMTEEGELEGRERQTIRSKITHQAQTSMPSTSIIPSLDMGVPAHHDNPQVTSGHITSSGSLSERLRNTCLGDLHGMTLAVQQEINGVLLDVERGSRDPYRTFPRRGSGPSDRPVDSLETKIDVAQVSGKDMIMGTREKCYVPIREANKHTMFEASGRLACSTESMDSRPRSLISPRNHTLPEAQSSIDGPPVRRAQHVRFVEGLIVSGDGQGHANGAVSRSRIPSPYPFLSPGQRSSTLIQAYEVDDDEPASCKPMAKDGN
ncbi:hypothetical protein BKA66DRAFT_613567 [Pyrenochaeta sp. MPI-SDFR-AT-0127]|nr:hypothetical protein BKA66DRAFT_613567 [Pyrenochaeta sp. MPI-SDFR-AT-0127]